MSSSRRSSLGGSTQDLRLRVIECLNRLADRDTLAIAAAELDGIARALTEDSFAAFLACLHNTDASARAPVRKHCVSLLEVLSESHGDSLSPFVARMVATVLRRIRDPDTAVRTACVEAAAAMSARITRPPFAAAFLRPLVEAMATEQDAGTQTGAALCLAAAIEAAPEPDAAQLRRSLPRLGKLARSEGFKAKAAVLALIGSVVGAGGASSAAVLDWLVPAVVEFLSSEDWAVRKAAAEALGRIAAAERDLGEKHRDSCLIALETRRFDKVKVVRETMNHTLELWKDVSSGSSEEIPSPTQSRSSTSTDNGIGRCFPPLSRSSQDSSFKTPQRKKSTVPTNRSPQSDSDGSSRSGVKKGSAVSNDTSPTSTVSSKVVDHPKKKPLSNWKIEISVPSSHSSKVAREDSHDKKKNNNEAVPELGAKHALFIKTREERGHRFGGVRAGSRVVPFDDYDDDDDNNEKKQGLDVLDCSAAEEAFDSQKDAEDLCLIREQLLQIENQQFSLLDLLQRFIGSSQSGLSSLETRVNGIEIALEEMSYNMAVSSGRIPNTESTDNACCKLPGADFLSSKFWRRAEGRYSPQRFSSSGTISSLNRDCGGELFKSEGQRFQHRNGGAFVPSPLADARINSRDLRNRLPKGIIEDSGSVQACSANGFNRA